MGVAQPPQRGNVAFWRYPFINPKCGVEDGKLICIQRENLTNTLLAVHCHPKTSHKGMRPLARYLNGNGATPLRRENVAFWRYPSIIPKSGACGIELICRYPTMLLILHSMVIQHAIPRAVRQMKSQNIYLIR